VQPEQEGTAIGALVPFTGTSAASGSNYERAMLLAIEGLNDVSESSGRRFKLVVEDSHSARDRTLRGLDELLRQNVYGLLGPDDVELVADVRQVVGGHGLAHVLPSSVTLADFSSETRGVLTRPAPAAEFVGCALANRVYGDLNDRMVVIHAGDPYRRAFAGAAVRSFESYRFAARAGEATALELSEDSRDYVGTMSAAAALNPDTIVVAADAPIAAGLVRAWSSLGLPRVKWFFEPSLRSEEFVRNVIVSSVEGAAGISLALPDQAEKFGAAFRSRWEGEEPLVASHFYFDAVIAVGLATLTAQHRLGREPSPAEVAPHVLSVVRGPGTTVSWQRLPRAVELINEGAPIHYVGAAGRWAVDETGASDGTSAIFGFWRIEAGRILGENFGACPAGTIPGP
jgi:ABC-type branched-subunit amino acid transport system substrate-binding protein